MDEAWRLLHLLAAAFWLGGLIVLGMLAVVSHRVLDAESFQTLMVSAGRAFLGASAIAWIVIAASGVALAAGRIQGVGQLQSTGWGRTLEAKTGLAFLAVVLAAVHSVAGRKTSSAGWVVASRGLSALVLLVTVGVFYLAVRLTEG